MSKTKLELSAELDALLERVRNLSAASPTPQSEAQAAPPEPVRGDIGSVLSLDFEELVELLKREIDELPAMTCLAIFGLGVLTGRLLGS